MQVRPPRARQCAHESTHYYRSSSGCTARCGRTSVPGGARAPRRTSPFSPHYRRRSARTRPRRGNSLVSPPLGDQGALALSRHFWERSHERHAATKKPSCVVTPQLGEKIKCSFKAVGSKTSRMSSAVLLCRCHSTLTLFARKYQRARVHQEQRTPRSVPSDGLFRPAPGDPVTGAVLILPTLAGQSAERQARTGRHFTFQPVPVPRVRTLAESSSRRILLFRRCKWATTTARSAWQPGFGVKLVYQRWRCLFTNTTAPIHTKDHELQN